MKSIFKKSTIIIAVSLAAMSMANLFISRANAIDINKNLACGASFQFNVPAQGCNTDSNGKTAAERMDVIVSQIINILSLAVGVVAVVMIIIGGLRYITSGGDSGNVTSAKNTILYAVVGLIVVAFAQVIVRFVVDRTADTGTSGNQNVVRD